MVGKLKISPQADAVRHLFMAFEKYAEKLRPCPFCAAAWPTIRLAHKGHLTGNHDVSCPFEQMAKAAEKCIILRDDNDEPTKQAAEAELRMRIASLLSALTKEAMPECVFPICEYPYELGHRLQCPFSQFKRDAGVNPDH